MKITSSHTQTPETENLLYTAEEDIYARPSLLEVLHDLYKDESEYEFSPQIIQVEMRSREIYERIHKLDPKLALEWDALEGTLTYAYELLGFKTGLRAAKSAEFQEIFGE